MQDMAEFVKNYPQLHYEKGQLILSAGETASSILVITSGFAKVVATDRLGNEQMLWIAGRLDIIPTEQLFSRTANLLFSYSALSPLDVYMVRKEEFLTFAAENSKVMHQIARGMSAHYDDLLHRLSSLTQASAREKLTYTLANIAERFSAADTVDLFTIGLHITHQDFASLIHASRETASIELKKLKDEAVIDYGHKKFVIHTSKLRKVIEAEIE